MTARPPRFALVRSALMALALLGLAFSLAAIDRAGRVRAAQTVQAPEKAAAPTAGYVGSKACSQCHRAIFNNFSRTDMGRSMSEVTPEFLGKIPNSASIFDARLNRHFEVTARDGKLYQSEYENGPNGETVFRESRKIEWIIGSGANGLGGLVTRGDFLYEAPLSFYSKTHSWALSPGYEFGDYGFNRPILPACIACHSGMPRAIPGGNGRFLEPPFQELAIDCENCHGPGEAHVLEMAEGDSTSESGNHSIVNPAKLTPWLANNICMSCHQTGDGRVLKPGKNHRDFRPGTPLDDTLAILIVPPKRDAPPQSDLLQHYFSMILSKCYRSSEGRLSCITCHDPHIEPSREEAPGYFREKCLSCHTEKSCAVPLAVRQRKDPPDDCTGCHMPKRDITTISHSSLTNHRIVATAEEPFPDETFHMTTAQLPDLVHLNAVPGRKDSTLSLPIILEAYAQLMDQYPQYRARYREIGKQLEASEPDNVTVLEALADGALAQESAEGKAAALGYLERAIKNGANAPADFERLATLLVGAGRAGDAVAPLQLGIRLAPYDVTLYRQLAGVFVALDRASEAIAILRQANEIFPQDAAVRKLLETSGAIAPKP
ncbi:MAG: hypothetical protein WCD40_17760 [Candidatus Acidiferrales bacterium]